MREISLCRKGKSSWYGAMSMEEDMKYWTPLPCAWSLRFLDSTSTLFPYFPRMKKVATF